MSYSFEFLTAGKRLLGLNAWLINNFKNSFDFLTALLSSSSSSRNWWALASTRLNWWLMRFNSSLFFVWNTKWNPSLLLIIERNRLKAIAETASLATATSWSALLPVLKKRKRERSSHRCSRSCLSRNSLIDSLDRLPRSLHFISFILVVKPRTR